MQVGGDTLGRVVQGVLDAIRAVPPALAFTIIALLVFGEAAFFAGFVVPGETAVLLGGFLASQGDLSIVTLVVIVVVSAILGDTVGYEVGKHLGPRLLGLGVFRKHQVRIENAQDLLRRRGGPAVFLGRWTAFFRAVMPGVAGLSRAAPLAIREGFGNPAFDAEGRYVEADLDLNGWRLTVGSLYLPKGGRADDSAAELARYTRKLRFLRSFRPYLTRARLRAREQGREFLVMGDFNIAHTRLDLRNWRTNGRSVGFLPEEREWFGSVLGPRRLVDVVRRLHPGEDGPYSWWSWMGNAFATDTGWRIDYQLATPALAAAATAAGTDRAASYDARMSDHAPVVVDYADR